MYDVDKRGTHSWYIFKDQINLFYPTIKFTAKYSKEEVNFLDLMIRLTDGKLKTGLFVKLTGFNFFSSFSL